MDYSLNNLNKVSNLKELTLREFINSLNLIGLEVDEISQEKESNKFILENINCLIKIPANRQDLSLETYFLQEIVLIFFLELLNIWNRFQKKYLFLLKKKYLQTSHYKTIVINSSFSKILTYAVEITDFKNFSSPIWIQKKLKNFKITSNNNIQDIFNLVIAEWGYEFNIIIPNSFTEQKKYVFERLTKIESFYEENGKIQKLLPGTIVIREDNQKIISVLGFVNSTFPNFNSSNYLIEICFYEIETNPLFISLVNPKTALKNFRKIFLENLKFSLQRLLSLIEILEYGKLKPIKYFTKNQEFSIDSKKILFLEKKNFKNFLNIEKIDEKIFQKAGLKLICKTQKLYFFQIPNSRKDLEREIDLIEEYSRYIGYKNFTEILPKKQRTFYPEKTKQIFLMKDFFLIHGFHEVINNSMQDFSSNTLSSLFLLNPLNKELSNLRFSLLPKLIDVFSTNFRLSLIENNFFEIGRVFKKENEQIQEETKVSGIFQYPFLNNQKDSSLEWFSAFGIIESFLLKFGYQNYLKQDSVSFEFFHPTRSILIKNNKKILGYFGQLHPTFEINSFSKRPIYIFELNLSYLKYSNFYSPINVYKEFSKYPTIIKDLSFSIDKTVEFEKIRLLIQTNCLYLKNIYFLIFFLIKKIINLLMLEFV
uniref:phenylalanine--tRNA ligase n=1 Tax=Mallomonas splendens TaxID=52552 RepID=A0A3G2QZN6_9STRA|nr:phenylalanyl tRNA synthetase beta subunit [Mallomonas splendens]AYO28523.1 phenylalanyl tRNA synthetase beta subunit [Mallomonas splendens]